MKKKYTVREFCTAALFAAIIFVATSYLQIPIPLGYAHAGDAFIFVAATLLPTPLAVIAATVGAGLADAMIFPLYIPATVIIKAASAAVFSSKSEKLLSARNITALALCAPFCVGGYYLYEVIITRSFAAPIASIPGNIGQWAASALIFTVIALTLDKTPKIKKYIRRNWH